MSEPNLPVNVPYKDHGQVDGVQDQGLLEGTKKGFSQTFRGRGRKAITGQGEQPQAAMRYAEGDGTP